MRKNCDKGRFILSKCGVSAVIKGFLRKMAQVHRCFLTKCTIWVHEDKNIKQMSHYAQETGRSMVEMLGILAIIGVLSVGGLIGYNQAMAKIKLNNIIRLTQDAIGTFIQFSTKNLNNMCMQDDQSFLFPESCPMTEVDNRLSKFADGSQPGPVGGVNMCTHNLGEMFIALNSSYGSTESHTYNYCYVIYVTFIVDPEKNCNGFAAYDWEGSYSGLKVIHKHCSVSESDDWTGVAFSICGK